MIMGYILGSLTKTMFAENSTITDIFIWQSFNAAKFLEEKLVGKKLCLILRWSMFSGHFPQSGGGQGSSGKVVARSPSTIKQILLDWAKAMTREYEVPTAPNCQKAMFSFFFHPISMPLL